jgi:hypothetical protein
MAHPILPDDQARALFAVLHDTTFTWTADRLPDLTAELGWTIDDSATIPGQAAIADVPWNLPHVAVDIQFSDSTVEAFHIPLASPANDPAAKLEIADAFTRFAALAQDIFGAPGERIPADRPVLRWKNRGAVFEIRSTERTVRVFWARMEFQDMLDKAATG